MIGMKKLGCVFAAALLSGCVYDHATEVYDQITVSNNNIVEISTRTEWKGVTDKQIGRYTTVFNFNNNTLCFRDSRGSRNELEQCASFDTVNADGKALVQRAESYRTRGAGEYRHIIKTIPPEESSAFHRGL